MLLSQAGHQRCCSSSWQSSTHVPGAARDDTSAGSRSQFLSLCGQDLQLAGGRRRLHDAPERGIMLTIFFVRTEFPPNRHRCTAILAALQADEEAESGRSGSQGGAFAFKKIRPRPRHHRDRQHPLWRRGVWKLEKFETPSSDEFEKVGAYWAYWPHHGRPSSSASSPP